MNSIETLAPLHGPRLGRNFHGAGRGGGLSYTLEFGILRYCTVHSGRIIKGEGDKTVPTDRDE